MTALPKPTVTLPRSDRRPADVFGPRLLGLTTAHLLSWQQGPGLFGALHLHSCWGVSSVLDRRYHGTTVSRAYDMLEGARLLAKRRRCARWKALADRIAAQILWQQAPDGGFFHAASENEPSYTQWWSCPIHQMLPVLGLLNYYEEEPADAPVRAEIRDVLARQLEWFAGFWWQRGRDFPSWCGVTNQDLVAVAALARYGQVIGDWEPYRQYGAPALETYLGPRYYHGKTGLFERGDRPNFTERMSYHCLIVQMLKIIHRAVPDARIPGIMERVVDILGQAVYADADGRWQMSFGVDDEAMARDGDGAWTWQRHMVQVSHYPEFIETLRSVPSVGGEAAALKLEETLARYVTADGALPTKIDREQPLFGAIPGGMNLLWRWLLEKCPEGIAWEDVPPLPCVRRTCGDFSFTSFDEGWVLREKGNVVWRGVKRAPNGVFGPAETLPYFISRGVMGPGVPTPEYAFVEPEPDAVEAVPL